MNKNYYTQKNKTNKTNKIKWQSFEQTFKKASKTKTFKKVYNEEKLRLKLAQQIREIRKQKKITQKTVAKRSDMTQSVIARLERGEDGISVDTLGRVAHALDKNLILA